MKMYVFPRQLSDHSKVYELEVWDGDELKVVFHCVDKDSAYDLINTLERYTVNFT